MWNAIKVVAGYIWRWDVVAAGAVAIFIAGGMAAIYGDDFNVATVLFFLAIAWLAAKAISWNEVTEHKDRVWISIVIAALGIGGIAGSMFWIEHRESEFNSKHQSVAENKSATPETNRGQDKDSTPLVSSESTPRVAPKQHHASPKTPSASVPTPLPRPPLGSTPLQTPTAGVGGGTVTGGIHQGDCGVAQVGGVGNVAAPNCGPPERHLTGEQRRAISDYLRGKQVIVHVGYLINVPDAQDYANELCDAIKEGIPTTDCSETWAMVEEKRSSPWHGFKFSYKGDSAPEGQTLSNPPDSPVGLVIGAMLAAGLNKGVGHSDPTMKDNEVTFIVGSPPKS